MNILVPRLGRICGWRRRRRIERAPKRAAFEAKQKDYGPLSFAVLPKKKVRSAWNSDRITLRRAAGVVAKRLPWIWKNAGQVLSVHRKVLGDSISVIQMAKAWNRRPLTKGGLAVVSR